MGTRSSSSPVIALTIRDFAWPRSPRMIMSCPDRSAFSISGMVVFSYPRIPGNSSSPDSMRAERLVRISSLMDLLS